jgi:recombinational DNA repair protein (RecF pathway)
VYTIKTILLARQIVRDKQIRTTLFTREYGRITAWEKKATWWDIGSLVEMTIDRTHGKNTVTKLSPLNVTDTTDWCYRDVIEFLSLFQIVKMCIPEWVEHHDIFSDLTSLIWHLSQRGEWDTSRASVFLLIQTRILKKLGTLTDTYYQGSRLRYIYDQIAEKDITHILLSWPLSEEEQRSLHTSIREALHTYSLTL